MTQLRLDNDQIKRALAALLDKNLAKDGVKPENPFLPLKDTEDETLTNFRNYLHDTMSENRNTKDGSTFEKKREDIGIYYPPGKLSSSNVKNICARLGIPFYMVFCQDFGDHKNGIYMRNFYKFKADDIMKLYQTHQEDKETHWLLKQKPAPYETSKDGTNTFQVLPVKEEPFDPRNPSDLWEITKATDPETGIPYGDDYNTPVTVQSCTTERALAKEELSIVAHDTNEKSGIDIIKTLANFIEFTDQRRYSLTLRNHALKDIFQVIIPQLNLTLLNGDFEDTLQHILTNTSSATEKEIRLRKLQNFTRPKGTSLNSAITLVASLFKKYHDLPEKAHFGPKTEKNKDTFNQSLHTFIISAIRQLVAPQLLDIFELFLKSAQHANRPIDLMQITYLLDKDEESKGCIPSTDMKLNTDYAVFMNNIMNKNHYQPPKQFNRLEHNNVSNTGALNSMNFERNFTGATDNVSDIPYEIYYDDNNKPFKQFLKLLPPTKKYNEGAGNINDSGELGAIPKRKSLPEADVSSNNMTSNHGHRGREMSKTSSSKQRQRSASKSPTVSFDSRSKSPNYNKAKEKFDKAYEKHKSRFRYKDYNSSRDSSRDSSYERKDRAKNRDRYESNSYSSSKESKSGSYKNNRHRSLSSENRNRSSSNGSLKSVNTNLTCIIGVNCNGVHISKCLKCLEDHHTHKCTYYYILAKKECSQCPGQLHYFSECQVMAKKKLLSSNKQKN